MHYIVCFSGGVASALVAIEAVRKAGKENVTLLNHDMSARVEHQDIKRFKDEVAQYCDVPITYANASPIETPLEVCRREGAFTNPHTQQALCTYNLKTAPFNEWLKENYPADFDHPRDDAIILYGFDATETARMQRRSSLLGIKGYKTDYPLAFWDRTIQDIRDIGIAPPITYKIFKHANCFPCLKAGKQHWYMAYCLKRDQFEEAAQLERELGYSIINGEYLDDLRPKYEEMIRKGICPNDRENSASFWARVNKACPEQIGFLPCDCAI